MLMIAYWHHDVAYCRQIVSIGLISVNIRLGV